MKKIVNREKLKRILLKLKKNGKNIGFTNGVFDLLHVGHVTYLEKSKRLCDILVVSLNTDDSARKLKGKGRPINTLKDRQKVMASLRFVDYVTAHPEKHVRKTLEILKPDFYIKGGDYKLKDLTSRPIVEKYGGKVIVLPIVKGKSTTNIIKSISMKKESLGKKSIKKKNKAVFLDRDGTINKEITYLHEPDKLKLLPNVIKGLKLIQKLGYKLIIVTNQPGIGLGYFTKEDFFKVNLRMLKLFSKNKIYIDKIYYCPHSLSEGCDCRKPKIGMFKRAEKDLNLDLKKSYCIGDKTSDVLAGKKSGCKTILVKTGYKGLDKRYDIKPDFVAKDLLDATFFIKK